MHKAYSLDLRERAVAAVEAGLRQAEVVRLFGVSLATLKRWVFKRRSGLSLASKDYRRGFATEFGSPDALAALGAQLEAHPDERLIDPCQRWHHRSGHAVSVATLHRARRALGWTHKKKFTAAERDQAERAGWRQAHGALKPVDLAFVDESGSKLALALRYGSRLAGKARLGKSPHQPRPKHHLIGCHDAGGPVSVHDGRRGRQHRGVPDLP
jgi:transposase